MNKDIIRKISFPAQGYLINKIYLAIVYSKLSLNIFIQSYKKKTDRHTQLPFINNPIQKH